MTLDVRYHPEALAELRGEIAWYEAQGAGLGTRFEAAADRIIDDLAAWPESGAVWPGWDRVPTVRSRRLTGFPFRLVYFAQPGRLVVLAIAHEMRRPGYWRERARAAGGHEGP